MELGPGQLMTSPNKRQLFDRWAPLYDLLFPSVFYQATHQRLLDYVDLPQHSHVLDIGCGTGRLLDRLAAKYPDLQGTGLDFAPEMLRQARRTNRHRPRLIFVQGNANPLRFADKQFDAVFNTLSFLHYAAPDQVFAEIYRVLRPGGRFYLVDPAARVSTETLKVPVSPGGIKFYGSQVREHMGTQVGFRCVQHQYLLGPNLMTMFVKEPS
ncbi:class I SAM-dependent methyltransferase [Leptolyngbyaceae cyanobacterium CCMR0082]|uniref:Class I SAM-dependent methyltransferase n=2 Tax=Adonisia TaxID=2950183 RepID=A0A6M0S7U6_9CYAN|nr:class I SAM-dependent methyltransferase [Adonisia turfae CCMR0082]